MRRFDAERGKPVASEAPTEQPALSHDTSDETDKGTLHYGFAVSCARSSADRAPAS
jgi:hypothetical protein